MYAALQQHIFLAEHPKRSQFFSALFHACNGIQNLFPIAGLEQILVHSILQCTLCKIEPLISGNNDKRDCLVDGADALNQIETVHSGHIDIKKHDIWILIKNHVVSFDAIPAGAEQLYSVAVPVDDSADCLADQWFVIGNDHTQHKVPPVSMARKRNKDFDCRDII